MGQSILDKYSFIITPTEASPVTYCTSQHLLPSERQPNSEIYDFVVIPIHLATISLSENEPRNEGVLEEFFAPQPYSPSVQGQLKSNFIFVFVGGRRTSQRGRAQKSSLESSRDCA